MPAHKAPKATARNPDRLANLALSTFVVIAAVGVATDAVASPRPASKRDEDRWLDDLVADAEHPSKAARKLVHAFDPPATPAPKPIIATRSAALHPAKPQKLVRAPIGPGRHRRPGKPVTAPQRPPEPSGWGRVHTAPKRRIPPIIARLLIEASASNMPSWQKQSRGADSDPSRTLSTTSGELSVM
jgi:hypothetical protein